ncbi:ribonuclease P protein component [Coxiella endosymbiont of Dermacentor marginatus]|uniref:ribonuclease P protein component n=1 Tax=Coxiella endosymbiont of Dermacentor marginatus TaxID=1656159 RepID=UPI002221C5A9|nr:ribonuclease P protein component [Coxiella endosymbiont of Dermacentor marginatus]
MNYNFSKNWRIRTTAEFRRVYSECQILSGHYCFLYYWNSNFNYSRLGVVASRKNLKKAVMRNRIRRIVKENFRLQKHRLPSVDIVFIAKFRSGEASKKELHECINQLLHQLIILSERSCLK